ncbi:MAG: aminopeptidase P family protein [Vicinamibacteria bacterium]|jgi:Xaa-Pro aminopeptidase|nr:aminopeptidase P family protein [Vicinamibacteria bacterium]
MKHLHRTLLGVSLLALTAVAEAASPAVPMPPKLPSLREQDAIRQEWLKQRLDRVLPVLMRRHGVQMWLVINREYNEDPVYLSLVSPSVMAARRRTILVFFDRGGEKGIERLALGGGNNGGLYEMYRDPDNAGREIMGDSQWQTLRKVIEQRKPSTIGINISHTHAFSDGLSAGEREQLEAALGPWNSKVVRAENLPLEYISVRLPEMEPHYVAMMKIVHALIARAFSNEVITPGKTTTKDVEWWLRQSVNEQGLGEWFPPTVSVQRPAREATQFAATARPEAEVIQRGDHLHVDFGIQAMGLATDTQHVGYVLKEGEKDAPAGLQKALLNSNRMQDIAFAQMRPGRTGNEVLASMLAQMKTEGIEGTMYTHPINDYGHGAGPLIGLWDRQEGVPGRGDVLLLPSTWFSIELQATTAVPEWGGQRVRSAQEEDAILGPDGTMRWVLSRQTKYHLVK